MALTDVYNKKIFFYHFPVISFLRKTFNIAAFLRILFQGLMEFRHYFLKYQ